MKNEKNIFANVPKVNYQWIRKKGHFPDLTLEARQRSVALNGWIYSFRLQPLCLVRSTKTAGFDFSKIDGFFKLFIRIE